jgi:cysteate synthase
MEKFSLKCLECNSNLKEKNFNFSHQAHDALIRSEYLTKKIKFRNFPGLWRFYDWLPVKNVTDYDGKCITYRNENLAEELGLEELYIAFNGYWPERQANLKTATFKELEAAVTIEYAKEHKVEELVIASAGNTAKAFAYVASREEYPVVLVVPKKCICEFRIPELEPSFAKSIIIEDGDYADAISVAKKLSSLKGLTYEGGVRNIARRDGLGTVLLDAVEKIGKMPKHYFQAVGTGTGGISAWEAAIRIREDGRFGKTIPKLHLVQNLPVAPMFKAWSEKRRDIIPEKDIPKGDNILNYVFALVLSNRYPAYSIKGGIYDALSDTQGEMYGITNDEAMKATELFESLEGIDILPAAGVAVASLINAVEEGNVDSKDSILLNITGGGNSRSVRDLTMHEIKTDALVRKNVSIEELKEVIQ